jgi:DNA-binding transcriptional ArsR family regulator
MSQSVYSASELFQVLGDATRLRILMLLLRAEMAGSQISQKLKVEKTLLSKHLSVLEKNGLIAREKRGRVNWFSICPEVRSKSANSLRLDCCDIDLKKIAAKK